MGEAEPGEVPIVVIYFALYTRESHKCNVAIMKLVNVPLFKVKKPLIASQKQLKALAPPLAFKP